MADIVKYILQRLTFLSRSDVSIADSVFKLHSVFTSRSLLVLSLFTFVKMLTTPMSCYGVGSEVVDHGSLAAYCELQDTYGIPNYHPVVNQSAPEDTIRYPNYYHMIPLVMAIQSLLFWLPSYIWKNTENGNISNLTCCFHYPIAEYKDDILSPEQQNKRMDLIVHYLVRTWGKHRNKAFIYCVCVGLNFAITLSQIGLIDLAIAGQFTMDGIGVYRNVFFVNHEERSDRISIIFPRIITCLFKKITPDGLVNSHLAYCALPYNFLNEKLLVLILSWMFVLTCCGLVAFLFWSLLFCIPCCQNRYLGNSKSFITPNLIEQIMLKFEPSNVGDWFMLWLLCKNMNSIHYDKLLTKLSLYKQGDNQNSMYSPPLMNKIERPLINSHENYELSSL